MTGDLAAATSTPLSGGTMQDADQDFQGDTLQGGDVATAGDVNAQLEGATAVARDPQADNPVGAGETASQIDSDGAVDATPAEDQTGTRTVTSYDGSNPRAEETRRADVPGILDTPVGGVTPGGAIRSD